MPGGGAGYCSVLVTFPTPLTEVESSPYDASSTRQQIPHGVVAVHRQAISGTRAIPTRLGTDYDPLFKFHRSKANLRILDIDEIKTVPLVLLSHPFVERMIATIRRDYLDQVPFWNATDLSRKLDTFEYYFNARRVHSSLGGVPPTSTIEETRPRIANLADYRWTPHFRVLFLLPVAT